MPTDEQTSTDAEIRRFFEEPQDLTSLELQLIVAQGLTVEQARETIAERGRVNAKAGELVNRPVKEWPEFEVKWDLEPTSFYWALDGEQPSALKGRNLAVRWCVLQNLDAMLTHQSQRSPDELWNLGDGLKLARVLVHCSEGRSLTPPWILPVAGKVGIVGGHHRLAMCRAKRLEQVPVLVEQGDLEQFLSILPLQTIGEVLDGEV